MVIFFGNWSILLIFVRKQIQRPILNSVMNILGSDKQVRKVDVERLCRAVERAVNKSMSTATDFDHLAESIFQRLHIMLSSATLKRVWGYVPYDGQPTRRTVDILSRFVGFNDFDLFLAQSEDASSASSPVLCRHINVAEGLAPNTVVTLYWYPDRVCSMRYLGESRFVVTSSVNTRLREGDTFCCNLMIEGEPLYLTHLRQGDNPLSNYVCGKIGGIHFKE